MTNKETMNQAIPHIERAHRCLEMLALFSVNKDNLSLAKRVPTYYNALVQSVLDLQELLLTDNEYTERVARNLSKVSEKREYSYNVTANKDGDIFYDIDAMLPLKEAKKRILLGVR